MSTVLQRRAPLNIKSIEDARNCDWETVQDHRGTRDILVHDPGIPGKPRLYMKRMFGGTLKDGLRTLLSRGRTCSVARLEYENLMDLHDAGIPACRPIAFGEDCSFFRERFSFIVTEQAPGDRTLLEFFQNCPDASLRAQVTEAVASLVRQLHDRGFAWPDLYGRHIFVNIGQKIELCLIDVPRVKRPLLMTVLHRARDLTNLYISIPLACWSVEDRALFLRTYCDGKSAALLKLMMKLRLSRLSRSKRARKFGYLSANHPATSTISESDR